MPSHHSRARDEGLRRVSSITRWALAGGAGLTGAFSILAAASYSGHTTGAASGTAPAGSQPASASNAGSASSGTLQPSSTPVQPSSGPAAVSSGGS